MKLYFGNMVTTVTTLMILSLVGFVGYSISNRGDINFWGRRSLFVLAYGLIICCFAAPNDCSRLLWGEGGGTTARPNAH